MLRPPDEARLQLSNFIRANHEPGPPAAMANELGLRSGVRSRTTYRRFLATQDRLGVAGNPADAPLTVRLAGGLSRVDRPSRRNSAYVRVRIAEGLMLLLVVKRR